MKQKLKALASLCLALALTLCLTLPAWAAGDGDAGQRITQDAKGNITVKDVESGVKVHVYQLMTVNVDDTAHQPQMPVYSWVPSVGDWLKGNANKTYQGYISKVENDYSVTEISHFRRSMKTVQKLRKSRPSMIRWPPRFVTKQSQGLRRKRLKLGEPQGKPFLAPFPICQWATISC